MIKKIAIALFLVCSSHQALAQNSQTTAGARVFGSGQNTGWNPEFYAGTAPGVSSQAAMLTFGEAYGWASSGPGYAKALANSYLTGPGDSMGFAAGSYYDKLRLSSAGMDGKSGRLTMTFLLDYELLAGGSNATPYLHFSGSVGNAATQLVLQGSNNQNFTNVTGWYEKNDLFGLTRLTDTQMTAIQLTTNFIWGSELDIEYRMLVQAHSFGQNATSAMVDAAHSAYWGGILLVETEGQAVRDFTVTSRSGADYSKSFAPLATEVPEPSILPLLAIGVGAFVGFARKRRKSV